MDNYIKRTSCIFLTHPNKGKEYQLYQALLLYANVVRYFIEMLWSRKDFKAIAVENLKYAKHNKRGKFSQQNNTIHNTTNNSLLTLYSQIRPLCGKIDRRNRSAERFKCGSCGFEENADIVFVQKTNYTSQLTSHNSHLTIYSLHPLQTSLVE